MHSGIVVGKLEGERGITLGFVDLMRDAYVEKDRSRGIYFRQDWCGMGGVMPVASGGIHVWHMPALTEIFGDVIREACTWSSELSAACEVWKEIKFKFETSDKL